MIYIFFHARMYYFQCLKLAFLDFIFHFLIQVHHKVLFSYVNQENVITYDSNADRVYIGTFIINFIDFLDL
jgi:hypothetical protein